MKKVKKYFDMILTAVICFFMGLVPGKKGTGNVTKVLTGGQGVLQNGRGGNGNSVLLHGWGVPEMEQKKLFQSCQKCQTM